jgi:glycosyltransferase involved in cell wall biosynthesis
MKVALVHDYLNQYGGAERVLEELHAIWPEAPVYTAICDLERMPKSYAQWDIRTSHLNRLPFAKRHHQPLLFMLPQAFEAFDLDEYDLVVSSSSGFAHGVLTLPQTLHLCYCHSPPRFLWDYHSYARREGLGGAGRFVVENALPRLRVWDRVSADRADAWIATSRTVRTRIERFYGKPSEVIPPPVQVGKFEVASGPGSYYLLLMRLVGWKRPDIAVEACTRLGLPLVVAGDGREMAALQSIAGPTVKFVGRADDGQIRRLLADCKALILPSEEDFGLTPLEAMAAGRPVIAYGRGGVLDTVVPGETGMFFGEQTADSLAEALAHFDDRLFDPMAIRSHAEQFDSAVFAERMRRFAEERLGDHLARRALENMPLAAAAIAPPPRQLEPAYSLSYHSIEMTKGASL